MKHSDNIYKFLRQIQCFQVGLIGYILKNPFEFLIYQLNIFYLINLIATIFILDHQIYILNLIKLNGFQLIFIYLNLA